MKNKIGYYYKNMSKKEGNLFTFEDNEKIDFFLSKRIIKEDKEIIANDIYIGKNGKIFEFGALNFTKSDDTIELTHKKIKIDLLENYDRFDIRSDDLYFSKFKSGKYTEDDELDNYKEEIFSAFEKKFDKSLYSNEGINKIKFLNVNYTDILNYRRKNSFDIFGLKINNSKNIDNCIYIQLHKPYIIYKERNLPIVTGEIPSYSKSFEDHSESSPTVKIITEKEYKKVYDYANDSTNTEWNFLLDKQNYIESDKSTNNNIELFFVNYQQKDRSDYSVIGGNYNLFLKIKVNNIKFTKKDDIKYEIIENKIFNDINSFYNKLKEIIVSDQSKTIKYQFTQKDSKDSEYMKKEQTYIMDFNDTILPKNKKNTETDLVLDMFDLGFYYDKYYIFDENIGSVLDSRVRIIDKSIDPTVDTLNGESFYIYSKSELNLLDKYPFMKDYYIDNSFFKDVLVKVLGLIHLDKETTFVFKSNSNNSKGYLTDFNNEILNKLFQLFEKVNIINNSAQLNIDNSEINGKQLEMENVTINIIKPCEMNLDSFDLSNVLVKGENVLRLNVNKVNLFNLNIISNSSLEFISNLNKSSNFICQNLYIDSDNKDSVIKLENFVEIEIIDIKITKIVGTFIKILNCSNIDIIGINSVSDELNKELINIKDFINFNLSDVTLNLLKHMNTNLIKMKSIDNYNNKIIIDNLLVPKLETDKELLSFSGYLEKLEVSNLILKNKKIIKFINSEIKNIIYDNLQKINLNNCINEKIESIEIRNSKIESLDIIDNFKLNKIVFYNNKIFINSDIFIVCEDIIFEDNTITCMSDKKLIFKGKNVNENEPINNITKKMYFNKNKFNSNLLKLIIENFDELTFHSTFLIESVFINNINKIIKMNLNFIFKGSLLTKLNISNCNEYFKMYINNIYNNQFNRFELFFDNIKTEIEIDENTSILNYEEGKFISNNIEIIECDNIKINISNLSYFIKYILKNINNSFGSIYYNNNERVLIENKSTNDNVITINEYKKLLETNGESFSFIDIINEEYKKFIYGSL